MIDRLLKSKILESQKSCFLLGPRQTGKTTLIQSLNPDLVINLARESTFLDYSSDPEQLEREIAAKNPQSVFIDEVQRLPSLLNTMQAIIDERKGSKNLKPIRFFLTGSSARKLKRGKANLLPGRVLTYFLGPLCAAELDYRVDMVQALSKGMLPEPYFTQDQSAAEKLLSSYSGSYLKEEIQAEALIRNIEGFSRFLAAAAQSSGQYLDLSKLARKAKIHRSSAIGHFEILEDTLIAHRCLAYPDIEGADLIKHPRYFFFDPGVLNGLLGNFKPSSDRIGNLFEHLFFSQLKASAFARDEEISIWNFRTRGHLEVDFIVQWRGQTWAIEIKAHPSPGQDDVQSLQKAASQYFGKNVQKIVAHIGSIEKKYNSIWVLPWQKVLQKMGL